MQSSKQLRQSIRAARNALSVAQRQEYAQRVAERVLALPFCEHAQHIAGYLAVRGELNPVPLLERLAAHGKILYLPVLAARDEPMHFAPYWPGAELKPNRYGILEPQSTADLMRSAAALDLVLTPLVAFAPDGARLGMGGGYYDRTFAFLNGAGHRARPILLGLAYELQKLPELARQPWDIPLHGIATEAALYPEHPDGMPLHFAS